MSKNGGKSFFCVKLDSIYLQLKGYPLFQVACTNLIPICYTCAMNAHAEIFYPYLNFFNT